MGATQKSLFIGHLLDYFFMAIGAFLFAFALEVFFIPNKLFDGGIVGIAMIIANILGFKYLP